MILDFCPDPGNIKGLDTRYHHKDVDTVLVSVHFDGSMHKREFR